MARIQLVEMGEEEEDEVPERVAAVEAFNTRHVMRSTSARGLLTELETPKNIEWEPLDRSFGHGVAEVFRNRLWLEEKYDPLVPAQVRPPRRRRRRRWRLDDSIWTPRKMHGNSKDYYETDASMHTIFDTDWELASASMSKTVERADQRGSDCIDMDDNGVHDALDEIQEILWEHRAMIYGAFDYYSALMDNGKDTHGEIDMFQVSYNAFTEFARDCNFIGKALSWSILDLIWTSCNSMPHNALEHLRTLDKWNHPRKMCRHEFMQALVRIATTLYITTKIETSASVAVTRLCENLETLLPPEALQNSNRFRLERCYNEHTERSLVRNQESLRAIFSVYARQNTDLSDELQDTKLMSIGEWLAFAGHFQLLQTGQLSYFGAKMIFKWSMIRARPDHTAASERKMRHLSFEDFMEALLRVACVMALPSDAEIEAAEAQDAGEYLQALVEANELDAFVDARKVGWMAQPRQHISRCMAHLASILVRAAKLDVHQKKLGKDTDAAALMTRPLTESEVIKFTERRKHNTVSYHMQSRAGLLDGIRAAASIVRARLLLVLQNIDIFKGLDDEQLDGLCGAMSQAPFEEGQYVFDQGDEGDTFFVITEGVAAALRTEADSKDEKELAILGEGAFFGERALLKNQVRYAGIRAESKQLFTMFITRDDFQRVLGSPLERLVPDQYRLEAEELVHRLAEVPLFSSLKPDQIQLVADRCTEVTFAHGKDIVTQGDHGNAFYVITKGSADVLRWPEDATDAEDDSDEDETTTDAVRKATAQPEVLSSLRAWDAFGERALLKNEVRYATVRVTTDELHAMCISRDVLEAALGRSLTARQGMLQRRGSFAGTVGLAGFVRRNPGDPAPAGGKRLAPLLRAALINERKLLAKAMEKETSAANAELLGPTSSTAAGKARTRSAGSMRPQRQPSRKF